MQKKEKSNKLIDEKVFFIFVITGREKQKIVSTIFKKANESL